MERDANPDRAQTEPLAPLERLWAAPPHPPPRLGRDPRPRHLTRRASEQMLQGQQTPNPESPSSLSAITKQMFQAALGAFHTGVQALTQGLAPGTKSPVLGILRKEPALLPCSWAPGRPGATGKGLS